MNLNSIDQKLSEMKGCVIDKETRYTIVRDRIDTINVLTKSGYSLKDIHKVLVDNGLELALNTFMLYVTKARKELKDKQH